LIYDRIETVEFIQESCAIAMMTVQCALYMSALKVFECALKIWNA